MEITMEEVLKLESFERVEVIAGIKGLYKNINNVYFMEVPDIFGYIEQNGLLLTTLYPIANDLHAIESLIPKLVEKGLSGVGIKPGRYISDIPDIMLEQANDYNFPLLLLPNNANLSILSNGVLEALLSEKTSLIEFRDGIHNKLISLLLEGADLKKLVDSLSDIINSKVILANNRYELIATSSDQEEIEIIKRSKNIGKDLTCDFDDIKIKIGGKVHSNEELLFNSIIASNECLGYFIALPNEDGFHQHHKIALEQASLLSAFLFQRDQAVLQRERNHLDSFVRDLLDGKIKSQIEIIQKAKVFRWDLNFPIILLNIEEVSDNEKDKEDLYTQLSDLEMMERILADKLNISPQKCKVIHHDDGLICFISVLFENRLEQRIQLACQSLISFYKNKYTLGISVSQIIENVNGLKTAYDESKIATKVFKVLEKNKTFIKGIDELGSYKLIHSIKNNELLREFVNTKIGVLLKSSDTDTISMIACLIKNNYNLQRTAKELFIHYNTLRYRLEKLRESGIDFDNGFDLAEIALAYKIYIYLNMNE